MSLSSQKRSLFHPARTLRVYTQKLVDLVHRAFARTLSDAELTAKALVFAPHPDDEVLGCGGTILKKHSVGAEVAVAILTDGSRSHEGFISREELAERRRGEAHEASARLGVDASLLDWLGFQDGSLREAFEPAVLSVEAVLRKRKPAQIYVPYGVDEHVDHVATRDIVVEAARRVGEPVTVYEYPVWYLSHWPWIPASGNDRKRFIKRSARQFFGFKLVREFDVRVDLDGIRDAKHWALQAHQSQVTRPDNQPSWPILSDVHGGEFLPFFFERELFKSYRLNSER